MIPVLEFDHVWRSFGAKTPVLNGVSLSLEPGEIVGLVGRNGAGKTTLIRIGMGMLYPDRGAARVFGMSPTEEPVAVKKRVGYVAEDQVLPPGFTVRDLIEFHRYLFPRWDHALEKQLLDRFSLKDNVKIRNLSKGQARQAALLCAVCHRPELLILDEPGGGLDPVARREFLETSIQLLNREGTAILFSSHHMSDVERIGGRVVLLDGGTIRLDRDLAGLREEVCVAMIPERAGLDADVIGRVTGCIRVRQVREGWHAVMEGMPGAVEHRIEEQLGIDGVRCVAAPLEELFIEMAGMEKAE
jgi:ABC-2 type transport system ATP-binding protein